MPVSIVIIDDHPVICHGLNRILDKEHSFVISGEANEWKSALKLVDKSQPDVAILDITLQGYDGISLISRMREVSKKTRVIMYTMHNSREYIVRSFHAGALGYVLKNDKTEELVAAVKDVMNRRIFLSSSIPDTVMVELIHGKGTERDAASTLSPREYEVASLIAQGLNPDQIAQTLFISTKTVRVHRTKIMHKLSCTGVHEMLLELRQHFPQQ